MLEGRLWGGYENVRLVDLCKKENQFNNDAEIGEYIVNKQPTMVFIGGMASTASLPRSLAISQAIKEIDSEIKIVFGGVHPTFMYEELMKHYPHIDFIVRGEGEKPSLELVKTFDTDQDITAVKKYCMAR
ncbi:MAG: cobalamin B12-binding domain-containing protein [Euryarchaeota archaeon]|nr:cobalamin B12-binding domain-containing protein [Euryarchaeota archaeon]